MDAISEFYRYENANIHRGIYDLSNAATARYEYVRESVANFLGTRDKESIAFTSGTTGAMNIIANSYLKPRLTKGKNVVTTIMEHHANFIPWQMITKATGAELRLGQLNRNTDIDYTHLDSLIDRDTQLVAINHISNTLGTINNIGRIIDMAHAKDVPVMIDAAQSAAYYNLDYEDLKYDFLTFSAHKIFGPFGVGVLFVAPKYVSMIGPYNYGGGIIKDVQVVETKFLNYPYNQDAGTPNVAGVIGLGAAIDFVNTYDKREARDYIHNLVQYAMQELSKIAGVEMLGNPNHRSGIISFCTKDIHPHDVASFLNKDQIAVRAGMHCTQPLLDYLQTPATVRLSLAPYNNQQDIDRLVVSLKELIDFWT